MSITVWTVVDVTPLGPRGRGPDRDGLAALLHDPPDGDLTVRGRFCGAALCGDPKTPPPERGAWLLVDHDVAVWVIGKPPRGKGWRLDPAYEGDSNRWLEVTGRAERCGAAVCLRAKSVALAPSPPPVEP